MKKNRDNEIYRFLERTLFWEGSVKAKYITDKFNVTIEKAESYLEDYSKDNNSNIDKNLSTGSILFPNDLEFKFSFAENNFDNILASCAENNIPFFEKLPILQPLFDKDILKEMIRGLNKRNKVLTIRYQSLNSSVPQERNIIPFSIYFVRGRYHIRAYCMARKSFRDFLLSRIISVVDVVDCKGANLIDSESLEFIIIKIKPHADLSDMQKMCAEMEYGMKNGIREVKVKKSLLIYLLDELRIGKDYYKPPFTVLELVNKEEIENILNP